MADLRFLAAAALASVGVAAGVATTDFGSVGAMVARDDRAETQPADQAAQDALGGRLDGVRRLMDIRPDQEEAWNRYADVALSLERDRLAFERRLAAGATQDDGSEYWRHQLVLAAAVADLRASLSPAQVALIGALAGATDGLICRGLSRTDRTEALDRDQIGAPAR